MGRTPEPAPAPLPDQGKPLPSAPLSAAFDVFAAMVLPAGIVSDQQLRLVQHAFYAGARATFNAVIDAMQEQASDDEETAAQGEERFASIELQIVKHFTEATAVQVMAPPPKRIIRP